MDLADSDPDDPPTTCGICGEPHNCKDCEVIEIKQVVSDTPVPSRARQSLPLNLTIQTMSDGSFSVVPSQVVNKATQFGPFEAKKVFTLNPNASFPLKIFQNGEYFEEMYLDTSNEADCNWMYFVQPASCAEEQNLACYQDDMNIFYVTTREIQVGEHLKVWYAPYYCKLMKKELLEEDGVDDDEMGDENLDINALIKSQQSIRDRAIWICKFCGKQETEVVKFACHITDHYHMQLRRICEICKETFQSRKALKKHVSLVHSNAMYANNMSLENEYLIPSNKEIRKSQNVVGGPLLNQGSQPESLDNCNVLLNHMMLSNFDMDDTNLLLESDGLNLSVDGLLSETENFDFNIATSEENFVCDICLKNFTKLKSLIQHLASHTGKYTCKICQKIFTRNENLVSHRCTSQLKCPQCGQLFTLKKYLTRHIALKHSSVNFSCENGCKKVFSSQKTLELHKCAIPVKLSCNVCQKEFNTNRNLKRHMLSHYASAIRERNAVTHLCEICSRLFKDKRMLKQHLETHQEPQFNCQVCFKKFMRRATFLDHMEIHKQESTNICKHCNQKFTLKKYLVNHMLMHDVDMKFKCSDCPQRFRQRTNMMTHFNRMHRKKCPNCDEVFMTADKLKQHSVKHFERCYECPLCRLVMKMKSSLSRHLKRKHPEISMDQLNIRCIERRIDNNNSTQCDKSGKEVEVCDTDIADLLDLKSGKDDVSCMQDIDSNLEYIVNSYDTSNLIENNFNDAGDRSIVKNLVESELDFNSLEMEFEKNFNTVNEMSLTNQEVCLSMPELGNIDQNITLGDNAFILDNGTIVDSLEQGKVLLYIFDKDENKAN